MEQQEKACCEDMKKNIFTRGACSGGTCSPVYCMGVVGAAVYFITHATTFWVGVLGVLKAFVWPAFVVHALLGMFYGL